MAAMTTTVCGSSQLSAVKRQPPSGTVRFRLAAPPASRSIVMSTGSSGALTSTIVHEPLSPSSRSRKDLETDTKAGSSSISARSTSTCSPCSAGSFVAASTATRQAAVPFALSGSARASKTTVCATAQFCGVNSSSSGEVRTRSVSPAVRRTATVTSPAGSARSATVNVASPSSATARSVDETASPGCPSASTTSTARETWRP